MSFHIFYQFSGSLKSNQRINSPQYSRALSSKIKSIVILSTPTSISASLPEMYFIVAECEIMKSGGNKEIAKARINDIRRRAAVPGKEAEMEVGVDKMTIDFILEERAREYCGEFMRWFDLKRTGKLVEYVKAHNPDIPLIQPHHAWRPIPQMFLDSILNPDEFGQNEGYN